MNAPGPIHRLLLPALLATLLPGTLWGAVYRCDGDDGVAHFSQFPCPGGARVPLAPAQALHIPPLSADERQLLVELARQQQAARERRREQRRRAGIAARHAHDQREQRCADARRAQEALTRQRRKGYSLGEARKIDRRDAELDAAIRENC